MDFAKNKRAIIGIAVCIGMFSIAFAWKSHPVLFQDWKNGDAVSDRDTVSERERSGEEASPVTRQFFEFTHTDIRRGQVLWQEPEDLGNLGWTQQDVYDGSYKSAKEGSSGGVRYVRVGTIVENEKYSGAEVIVVLSWFYGDYPRGNAPAIGYYLRLGNGDIVFLPYASVPNGEEIRLDAAIVNFDEESAPLVFRIPNKIIDENTRIEDLASRGDEIQGANSRQVFIREPYAGSAFFSPSGLKLVFDHPQFGQMWMVDATLKRNGNFPLNQYVGSVYSEKSKDYERQKTFYDPVVSGGFYLRQPDGLVAAYRLKMDIFDVSDRSGILQATWNDGKRNETEYEQYPSGCGSGGYAYDVTGVVDIGRELVKTGVTNMGDAVYEYTASHAELKKYYEETFLPSLKYLSTDGVQPDSSWENFLQQHAVVFWVDPFGRLLKFFNANTFPLAECGKPVVYLYPTKTLPVSVRVFPSEGVSVSEPAYNDGWSVIARPDGTLLNKADRKEYSSLFWEGGSDIPYQTPHQGFVVKVERLDMFFSEKLKQLGLIGKEISDFKEFWIPKMLEVPKPYYFVTFLSRETIDQLAPIQIEPRPDTVIRVMMDYQGLDSWKDVPSFVIRTPERKGFTAVEWGGRLKR